MISTPYLDSMLAIGRYIDELARGKAYEPAELDRLIAARQKQRKLAFAAMSSSERERMMRDAPAAYAEIRAAALGEPSPSERRAPVARDYGRLSNVARARLKKDDPARFKILRDEWIARGKP